LKRARDSISWSATVAISATVRRDVTWCAVSRIAGSSVFASLRVRTIIASDALRRAESGGK
jgi:hypothetical protein